MVLVDVRVRRRTWGSVWTPASILRLLLALSLPLLGSALAEVLAGRTAVARLVSSLVSRGGALETPGILVIASSSLGFFRSFWHRCDF